MFSQIALQKLGGDRQADSEDLQRLLCIPRKTLNLGLFHTREYRPTTGPGICSGIPVLGSARYVGVGCGSFRRHGHRLNCCRWLAESSLSSGLFITISIRTF